ncbi:MAG: hypothetical protein Q4B60_02985 [Erysipelotrichaceae bacterium]|nr:hypothetical protein [Erysipelotrichaceae bacterium]
MASKKRDSSLLSLLVIVVLGVLIGLLIFFGFNRPKKPITDKPTVTEPDNKIKESVELVSYKVYEDDGSMGFNFALAELKFFNIDGVNYDLKNLKTDEGIKLDDYYFYEKKMAAAGIDYSLLEAVNEVVSENTSLNAVVFIPYSVKDAKLMLTDTVNARIIEIDTSKNKEDLGVFKYVSTPDEIKTKDYDLSVSKSYESTTMKMDGENYTPSMLSIYTFDLNVKAISNGIKITKAEFVQSDTNEKYEALDETYYSTKIGNIINRDLRVGDTYALFFEVFSNPEEKSTYAGKITLYFSDGSAVTIDTVLR